jgi:DNA invertase Pin-like site-specific DNA recombinase
MKLAGYCRVSTKEQNLDKQIESIKRYCEFKKIDFDIFQEKASAVKERLEFDKMMQLILEGKYDGLIATDLDRVGRSVMGLSNLIHQLKDADKTFIIINRNIDTSTTQGKLMYNIFASFAEFERDIIRERLQAGKKHTGRYGGRNRTNIPKEAMIKHYQDGASYEYIASIFKVHRSTVYRRLKEWGVIKDEN